MMRAGLVDVDVPSNLTVPLMAAPGLVVTTRSVMSRSPAVIGIDADSPSGDREETSSQWSPGGMLVMLKSPSAPGPANDRIPMKPPVDLDRIDNITPDSGCPCELRTMPLIRVILKGTSANEAVDSSDNPTV